MRSDLPDNRKFRTVFFDIVGYCNAKCPYCHSGSNKIKKVAGKVNLDDFKNALKKLVDHKILADDVVLHLYNWGEPLLHPQINDIASFISDMNIKYALSTNASKVPEIDTAFAKNLDMIAFSMSGFSQRSCDRVHGFFDVEVIKENIKEISTQVRKCNQKTKLFIYFHVYAFNQDELRECQIFASRHGIMFKPYLAILNNWWDLLSFVHGNLSEDKAKKIGSELLSVASISEMMRKTPLKYVCPQLDYLVIDERFNVSVCCQIPSNHPDYSCGNLLLDDLDTIIKKRMSCSACKFCIDSGLAFYLNNSFVFPRNFKLDLKQKYLYLRSKISQLIA